MGYGDYCLLIFVRDLPEGKFSAIGQVSAEFGESMIASALRRRHIEILDDGTVRLTAKGRAAIERFPTDKSAVWYRQLDAGNE